MSTTQSPTNPSTFDSIEEAFHSVWKTLYKGQSTRRQRAHPPRRARRSLRPWRLRHGVLLASQQTMLLATRSALSIVNASAGALVLSPSLELRSALHSSVIHVRNIAHPRLPYGRAFDHDWLNPARGSDNRAHD